MKKMKVKVVPALSKEDRKQLSSYIQGLKHARPRYFEHSFSFVYRGSTVTVTPPNVLTDGIEGYAERD